MADGEVSLDLGEKLVKCRIMDDYAFTYYCREDPDGNVYIPKALVDRWRRVDGEFDAIQEEIREFKDNA